MSLLVFYIEKWCSHPPEKTRTRREQDALKIVVWTWGPESRRAD